MNKLKYILGLCTLFIANSCTDFVDPAIPYSGFETGAYLRTISSTATFNFFQLPTSSWNITIDAVDEENGNLVQEVDVFVARRRGATVSPEVKIATIPKSAFSSNPDSKYQRASFTFSVPDALTAMGMTEADITGGDFFEFRLSLLDTKGRRFSNDNQSGDVAGGAFYRSPFFYRVPVVCPSELAGTYTLSTATPSFCGTTYNGQVRFVAGTIPGSYIIETNVGADGAFTQDFSFGAYRACYGAGTTPPGGADGLRFTDACGQLGFNALPSSPWGDNFTMLSVSSSGAVLTLEFETSWSPEGGTATITRTDGTNWPPGLRL